MESAPVVTLSSGVRVANFSSPHPFQFDDGSVLPGCSPERANALMLHAEEVESPTRLAGVLDIELLFMMSDAVRDELGRLVIRDDSDVILVPLPVMHAVKESDPGFRLAALSKARTCRVVDRVAKTISSTRFCR